MCLNALFCFLYKKRLTKTVKANILYPLTPLFDTILFSFSGQQRFTCGSLYTLLQELSDIVTWFGALADFRKATTSFVTSVCPSAWNNSAPTGRIFMKFEYVSRICRGNTRVGTLIVATIYLQLIQKRHMFRSFTVLQCSHQHCVQPVASDVEVVGYF